MAIYTSQPSPMEDPDISGKYKLPEEVAGVIHALVIVANQKHKELDEMDQDDEPEYNVGYVAGEKDTYEKVVKALLETFGTKVEANPHE